MSMRKLSYRRPREKVSLSKHRAMVSLGIDAVALADGLMTPPTTPRRKPKFSYGVASTPEPLTPMRVTSWESSAPMSKRTTFRHANMTPPPCVQLREPSVELRVTPWEPSTPPSKLTTFLHSSMTPPPFRQHRDSLIEAIESERYEDVNAMLEIDDSSVYMPVMTCFGYESALVCAIRSLAPVDILSLLLRHGAVVDERDSNGETPLMLLAGSTQVSLHEAKPCIWHQEAAAGIAANKSFGPFRHISLDGSISPLNLFGSLQLPKRGIRDLTEERCMAYASCLLLNGASPSVKSKDGMSIASRASKSGRHSLSNLLCQWQSCSFLRTSWRRKQMEDQASACRSLWSLDIDSLETIFAFILPFQSACVA